MSHDHHDEEKAYFKEEHEDKHKVNSHGSKDNIGKSDYGSNNNKLSFKKSERLFTNEQNVTDEGKIKKTHKHHHHHHDHKSHRHSDGQVLGKDHQGENPVKDPLLYMEAEVSEDFYALTWVALKKEIWVDKKVYDQDIFLTDKNYLQLKVEFLVFAMLISLTVWIMLYQTFKTKTFEIVSWRLEILRILIVGFAQRLLFPEIHKGSTKLRYVLENPNEFNSPNFATFVSFWQILMSAISYCLIVIFMCMSNEALPLVMHFAEVAILIELDDWIGEMIVKEVPDEGDKPDDVCAEGLNEEMSMHMKLALVREDLKIINDLNVQLFKNPLLQGISWFFSHFPFFLLPLISTLGFEYLLAYYQPTMVHVISVGGHIK